MTLAVDGSLNVTVVAGNATTGLHAADGSINVIVSNGSGNKPAHHPCGAWYVTSAPSGLHGIRAADGSLYVSTTPYTNGGQHVTVVSGSL